MSSSELRYLIAAQELGKINSSVKQMAIASRLKVSKVSVYNAIERLKEKGYVIKDERNVMLTPLGIKILNEYETIIKFIEAHLVIHCNTPKDIAHNDALEATCSFSDLTRENILKFIGGLNNEGRI